MSFYHYPERSYFNTASHYLTSHAYNYNHHHHHNTSSYYNDMYRSFTNLRSQPLVTYHQPLYISTIPFSLLKKSDFCKQNNCKTNNMEDQSKGTNSSSRLSSHSRSGNSLANTIDSKLSLSSTRYLSNANSFEDEIESIPAQKREGSYDSVYNSSRSSTPSNLNNNTKVENNNTNHNYSNNNNMSNEDIRQDSYIEYNDSNQNSKNSYQSLLKPNNEDTDLTATAVSSIQLNCTDDLTTQVDYYINEVFIFFK
jgi:hypothetical protein